MRVSAAVAPLIRGSTYRRAVYLLLGGVILLPYVLLATVFAQMFTARDVPVSLLLVLVLVTGVIASVPAFLRATRTLEIVAVRGLLGVDLPDPTARPTAETRFRGALWFAAHLLVGGGVWLAMVTALPMALAFVAQQFGIGERAIAGFRMGPFDERDTIWLSVVGIVLLILLAYAIAGLGALAALVAPVLLGPSPAERLAALEARAGQLAERNRLARELHDSIGHALTITTLQAAAAREVLGSDLEFVRRALTAVEETGRAAMEDLDHVLGLLREDTRPPTTPQRTLADLDRLLADAGTGGVQIDVDTAGPIAEIPAALSREGYRIVQESLTNAARHARGAPVSVRVSVVDRVLAIDVENPLSDRGRSRDSGHGLAGIRERVAFLRGRMTAGADQGVWRVSVRLPTGARRLREPV